MGRGSKMAASSGNDCDLFQFICLFALYKLNIEYSEQLKTRAESSGQQNVDSCPWQQYRAIRENDNKYKANTVGFYGTRTHVNGQWYFLERERKRKRKLLPYK